MKDIAYRPEAASESDRLLLNTYL
ncbi:hypothetical protein B14911_17725 [Bacillus sp. NRRL B-14911]|nr:hypothetical protein B14911_17725 [Bacillus sp. NRRL B-14911]